MLITISNRCTIVFPHDFDSRSIEEMADRGYLSHIFVVASDGRRTSAFFHHSHALQQELRDLERIGQPFFAELGWSCQR